MKADILGFKAVVMSEPMDDETPSLSVVCEDNVVKFALNGKPLFTADWKGNLKEKFQWAIKNFPTQ